MQLPKWPCVTKVFQIARKPARFAEQIGNRKSEDFNLRSTPRIGNKEVEYKNSDDK